MTTDNEKVQKAREFLEVCGTVGQVMELIHLGLTTYLEQRETASLEKYELLNDVFVKALPALDEVLSHFNQEYLSVAQVLEFP